MLLVFSGEIEARSWPIGSSMLWRGQELNDGGQGVGLPNGVRSDGSSTTPLKTRLSQVWLELMGFFFFRRAYAAYHGNFAYLGEITTIVLC
jgi:hypothetical protein